MRFLSPVVRLPAYPGSFSSDALYHKHEFRVREKGCVGPKSLRRGDYVKGLAGRRGGVDKAGPIDIYSPQRIERRSGVVIQCCNAARQNEPGDDVR
jgi:hypothetical protein